MNINKHRETTSLGILLLFCFAAFVVWLIPITIFIMPGVAVWLSSHIMDKVFRKHIGNQEAQETDDTAELTSQK